MTREENRGKRDDETPERKRRGEHNEIGYRNVDEQAEHDEAGSQGPGPGESPPRER
jgi:hypothetical protein